ncbi:MAG: yip1 [Pedosphaera sp.]|nr:yip1 [Pedosphaera sp.]
MTNTESPPNLGEPVAPKMSLGGRLMNVFISPSEVFDEAKSSPHEAMNWIVPAVAAIIAGIIYSMVVFSQPQIGQAMREAQEKQMQTMVDKGRMTRQQADRALAMSEQWTGPTAMKVYGIVGSIIGTGIKLSFIALLLWLIGNFALKTPFDYGKAIEVAGLAGVVSVLDSIVRMLLAVIFTNPSMNLGPVLFVGHFDPQNRVHALLAWCDVFLFWEIALWSLGLARLSGQSFLKSFLWVFGCVAAIAGSCMGIALSLSKMMAGLGGK